MANFCIWALLHLSGNILRISDFLKSSLKLLHLWKHRTMALESKIKILELACTFTGVRSQAN